MVAILEDPDIRQLVRRMSVADYEQYTELVGRTRTELIRGILIDKVTSSPFHSFLIARLQKLALAAVGTKAHCRQEQPLKTKDSMPEPDLAVVTGQEGDYRRAHPTTALLVVEVAVTTLGLDRAKAAIYAESAGQEYWLVVAGQETVEVYTEPRDGSYRQCRVYTRAETLVSAALPVPSVELDALFRD